MSMEYSPALLQLLLSNGQHLDLVIAGPQVSSSRTAQAAGKDLTAVNIDINCSIVH
jgi:hypothetical protein